jgi:SAM-dependent methyltransferase
MAKPLRQTWGRLLPARLRCYDEFRSRFAGCVGLEVGGPSDVFRREGLFPLYPIAARVDSCNFASKTVWDDGAIASGDSFPGHEHGPPGGRFIAEATQLTFAASDSYDFVLSSHMLEHSANPVKALLELKRIVKPDGSLLIVLPHRDATFDHRRPVTTLEHLLEDFDHGTAEDDLTHLPEILALHDLSMDPPAGDLSQFTARCKRNFENRCMHHHVFDTRLGVRLVDAMTLEILAVEAAHPLHIAIIARKLADGTRPNNGPFLSDGAAYRRTSPFPSDQAA